MKKKYVFEPKSLCENEIRPDLSQDLLIALDHIFLSIIRLDLDTGRAWLLQCAGQPKQNGYSFDWTEYLEFYSNLLIPHDRMKLTDSFSITQLRAFWNAGQDQVLLDPSCCEESTPLLQISALFQRWGDEPFAYILTRRNGDHSLLQKIIDLYVYNTCDYFIYLDARKNSYTMFSGSATKYARFHFMKINTSFPAVSESPWFRMTETTMLHWPKTLTGSCILRKLTAKISLLCNVM